MTGNHADKESDMSKHTPGPWTPKAKSVGRDVIMAGKATIVAHVDEATGANAR
jgi:hypothetical protein